MRWLTNPVAQFLATGFVTLVVVIIATSALSRSAADEEAVADARSLTWVLGTSVAQPAIPRGLVDGDAAAIDRLDRTALDRLLVGDVLRIKIWDRDGTVLYSDRTELIGAVYPLDDDELEVMEAGGTDAELSDLDKPENRFERTIGGDLLEVYTRIESPEGEPLLFEAYLGVDRIRESRAQVLDRFLPITIGSLLALVALSTPLVWLLSRRISRAARERERLLEAAVRASDDERLPDRPRPPRRRRAGPGRLVPDPVDRRCPRSWRRPRGARGGGPLAAGEHARPALAPGGDLPAGPAHRRHRRRDRRPRRAPGRRRRPGGRRRQRRRGRAARGGGARVARGAGVRAQRRAPRRRRTHVADRPPPG